MLSDKLKAYTLILASRSPRRIQLLKDAGIPFQLAKPHDLEESYPEGMDKFQIPMFLAEMKSLDFGPVQPSEVLITADTIVWLDNRVINKPSDDQEAVKMLTDLSGKMHEVITGVCLRTNSRKHCFNSHTEVYFSELSEEEIQHYISCYKPLDKAGAYGIQEWIGFVGIEKINGSYFNVMGLPVHKLYRELEGFL